MSTAILSKEQLRTVAPSIFATTPWEGMSSSYRFIGTDGVIDIMDDLGFRVVKAAQSRTRIEGKRGFTRHFLRLRHVDHLSGQADEVPEIIIENSHDRTSAYRLHAGIHRFVCENGLIISSADFGTISVKHSGSRDIERRIIEATREIAERTPQAFETVQRWKQIILPRSAQIAMAEEALALKPLDAIQPSALLTARREADYTDSEGRRDLWRSFNVIEENMMIGGIQGVNTRGRRTRTRSIRSVAATIGINRSLWRIAEQVAEWN